MDTLVKDDVALVDVDPYDDGGFPEFRNLQAPGAVAVRAAVRGKAPVPREGLATRRQLREKGLRPGGQPIAAQVMRINRRTGGPRVAYLYRVDLALPVRPMTFSKWGALALAMLARRTCPSCRLDVGYCIPRRYGVCGLCLINLPAQAAA